MNIAVSVAEFHKGNTSEYVVRALRTLGHQVQRIRGEHLAERISEDSYDLYLCIDSGEPFNFISPPLSHCSLRKLAFWFIDYRHNKHRETRLPNDFQNALSIDQGGGWIFQSQEQDVLDCHQTGITRSSWLPLAADPEIWDDAPSQTKEYDVGFVGNVWDKARAQGLQMLLNASDIRFAFQGHGGAWMKEGAQLLRRCRTGFNINSYFGTEHSYDINMRVFETLSCGIPLITNSVPTLRRIFPESVDFIREYTSYQDLLPCVTEALRDRKFLESGSNARNFILNEATYVHRMETLLMTLRKHGFELPISN